jgi:hypothetical protein
MRALVQQARVEALVLIELVMSRLDAPGPLANFAQRCAEFNFPQLATVFGRGPKGSFDDTSGHWQGPL